MDIERLNKMIKNARVVRLNGEQATPKGIGTFIKSGLRIAKHIRLDVSDDPHGWLFFEEDAIRKARISGNTVNLVCDAGKNYELCLYPWRQKQLANVPGNTSFA